MNFSEKIKDFLDNVDLTDDRYWTPVPKSDSCGDPGDFLMFRYQLGAGKGSRAQRLVMLVRPVTRDARTGNLLLTVVKLNLDLENLDIQYMKNLYTNRDSLPEENYRTYIMTKIFGNIYRLKSKAEEENI